jgi:hypothetical protein
MLSGGTVWDSEEQGNGTPMLFQEAMFVTPCQQFTMPAMTQWIHTPENKGAFPYIPF